MNQKIFVTKILKIFGLKSFCDIESKRDSA